MTLTFTGAQFEVEFYAAMYAWVARGKQEPDPRTLWESGHDGKWVAGFHSAPTFASPYTYRWKPAPKRMVKMYDAQGKPHELVAPETEAPANQTVYFYSTNNLIWQDLEFDRQRLADGLVFLAHEDAQAMADFQRMQRGVK